MAIDPPPPNPDRERLEALVAFSRNRVSRGIAKLQRQAEDNLAARAQLEEDEKALAAWIEANPPDQPDLL